MEEQGILLYTDWLWFREVGYQGIFLTTLKAQILMAFLLGVPSALVLWFNLSLAQRLGMRLAPVLVDEAWEIPYQTQWAIYRRRFIPLISLLFSLLVAVQAGNQWELWLKYWEGAPFQRLDPLFGRDIGFYVFTLPFWNYLRSLAMSLLVLSLIGVAGVYFLEGNIWMSAQGLRTTRPARKHLFLLGSLLLLCLAVGFYLDRYDILYSSRGVIYGANYADVEVLLPALGILAILALLAALVLLLSVFRQRNRPAWLILGLLVVVYILGIHISPYLFQRLVVLPNEPVKEAPYIIHNIAYTRQGYNLDAVDERRLTAEATLEWQDLQRNELTIKNIRLWDHQPLLDTYGQIQEIRTYYEFVSVDNDRYTLDGEYRQVMLSPREILPANLPSRTWINEHLIFTHGFGITLGPVNSATTEGLPDLLIKDIPPVSTTNLKIERPEIYYGELTDPYVFVNTQLKEFDYPAGEENVYTRYEGKGGIAVDSLFHRALFATRFRSLKILLSQDITERSRLLFYRRIDQRMKKIAPFLRYDKDPYLVVSQGRLYWIYDAYTTTDRYPYSLPIRGMGNYIRNSVKAVIDAYQGEVRLYVADPQDPLIQTYSKIFPGAFSPLEAMPEGLRRHIRYPQDLFSIQTRLYATYHMTTPQVFYNKEDLWEIPTSIGKKDIPMEPYYIIMKLPREDREQFILMLPFTPKGKDNLAAWMIARCDPPDYGKLVVYRFPKQKLIYGPRQIESRINQEADISRQISLWDQRGSQVIQGTLLVIPVEESLIYVQPLYLKAENGKIPELKRVIVAYENEIVMEETLEKALERLFRAPAVEEAKVPSPLIPPIVPALPGEVEKTEGKGLAAQAWQHFQQAQELQRKGEWARYGEELKRLEEVLKRLQKQSQ